MTSRLITAVRLPNEQFGDTYDALKQKRFLQDVRDLATNFNQYLAQTLSAAKKADTSRTGTAVTADPNLFVRIPGAGIYELRSYLLFTAAGGIVIELADTGNAGNAEVLISRQVGGAAAVVQSLALGSSFTDSTNAVGSASVHGTIIATGATTVSVSWASNTNGQTATLKAGSLLIAQQVVA